MPNTSNITENSKLFTKIRSILVKKIIAEVEKMDFEKKKKSLSHITSLLTDVIKQEKLPIKCIESRLKTKESLINKVIRKLYKISHFEPDSPLDDILQDITQENIQSNIHDILGIRIVVEDNAACYELQRKLETKNMFLIDKIHDYIDEPKENGYQALQIVMQYPAHKEVFELQIMTAEMLDAAKHGEANRSEYAKGKQKKFFRNIAILAVAAAATGGLLWFLGGREKKQ